MSQALPEQITFYGRDTFYEHAQKAGLKIHCDLQRQARAFWRQNAEALQTGRYRKRA